MTWTFEKVAKTLQAPEFGGLLLVALLDTRDCGCIAFAGIRMDTADRTFSASSCDDHRDENERAMFVFGHTPPSGRGAFDFWRELLEREIAAVPA